MNIFLFKTDGATLPTFCTPWLILLAIFHQCKYRMNLEVTFMILPIPGLRLQIFYYVQVMKGKEEEKKRNEEETT